MRVIPTQVATGPTSPHDGIKKTPVRGELSVARPSSRYLQCHCQQALFYYRRLFFFNTFMAAGVVGDYTHYGLQETELQETVMEFWEK